MNKKLLTPALVALAACAADVAHAQERVASASDLAELSLEQLANVTVTSASRRVERLLDAPASIFVVTAEDIRRAGVTTLYEALRLAPNLQVMRGDANQAIASARGGLFGTANKMLVLIDGRTVYSPLFSGVFSDAQDVLIEDIERIEVISGPGSTLWGTNAVNGVVNVITRPATRTLGLLGTLVGGEDRREAAARFGAPMGSNGAYRAYVKYQRLEDHRLATGAPARDASERWQVGFRADQERGDGNATLQGDVYGANVDNLGGSRDLAGGNLRGRWSWRLASGELMVQSYYDRTEREHLGSFREKRDTFDVEAQHVLRRRAEDQFVWGADYRASKDRTDTTPVLGFLPPDRVLHFLSVYAQEERTIAQGLRGIVGLRAERNDYTGWEWLPNARLSWAITADTVVWTALTRTVRAPSRIDRDLVIPGAAPFVLVNNDSFRSELATVGELGWRQRLAGGLSLSATAFHHRFTDLRTLEAQAPALVITNAGKGRISGVEGWIDAVVTRNLRLQGGFMVMNGRFDVEPGHTNLDATELGNNPKRTALLRASWTATPAHELDLTVRHVDDLPRPLVPSYTVVDARVGWKLRRDLDLSLVAMNLFDRKYSEFGSPAERAVFERAIFLKVTWTPS